MEWGFILAIVAFAALLQLAFFWYFLKVGQRNESVYPKLAGDSGDDSAFVRSNQPQGHPTDHDGEGDRLTCQTCGFENEWDAVFTYCANCASKLG